MVILDDHGCIYVIRFVYVIARLCSSNRWISSGASSWRSPTALVQTRFSFLETARSIRRQALITVLWFRLPIRIPISGKLSLAVLRTRYIATDRARLIVRWRRPDMRSL